MAGRKGKKGGAQMGWWVSKEGALFFNQNPRFCVGESIQQALKTTPTLLPRTRLLPPRATTPTFFFRDMRFYNS